MAFRTIRIALLLAILPVAGCGTVSNLVISKPEEGGRSPFGGVRRDLSCIQQAANGEDAYRSDSAPQHYPQAALMLLCAVDLPFSFVGDLVTWPYVVTYAFVNQPIPTPPVALPASTATQASPTPPATQPMQLPTLPVLQVPANSRPQPNPQVPGERGALAP